MHTDLYLLNKPVNYKRFLGKSYEIIFNIRIQSNECKPMENSNSLTFKPIMKAAWELTKGMKWKLWTVIIYTLLCMGLIHLILHVIDRTTNLTKGSLLEFLLEIIAISIVYGIFWVAFG